MSQEVEGNVIYSDENITVSFQDVGEPDTVLIHTSVHSKFTKGLYEEWLLLFEDIKQYASNQGYSTIVTGHDEATPQMIKFWGMFGFDVFEYGEGYIGFMETVKGDSYG